MTSLRIASKQQIAATRALVSTLTTSAMRPPHSAQDTEAVREAFERLHRTTEQLARATYCLIPENLPSQTE